MLLHPGQRYIEQSAKLFLLLDPADPDPADPAQRSLPAPASTGSCARVYKVSGYLYPLFILRFFSQERHYSRQKDIFEFQPLAAMRRQQIGQLCRCRKPAPGKGYAIVFHQVRHLDQFSRSRSGLRRVSSFTKLNSAVSTCISQILSGLCMIKLRMPVSRIQFSNSAWRVALGTSPISFSRARLAFFSPSGSPVSKRSRQAGLLFQTGAGG